MKLTIFIEGQDVLRKPTEEIKEVDSVIKQLISDMYETLGDSIGVGLSAPQVGKSLKLFVIDADKLGGYYKECQQFKKTFINPVIVKYGRKTNTDNEGCLSIPGIIKSVKRSESVTVEYFDEEFNKHKEKFSGFIARIIQHEYDHLDGKLMIDYK